MLRVCLSHTNMDRLYATLTRNLIRHAIFSLTGPARRVDCLAPLWKYKREMTFPRTQQRIVAQCQLSLLSTELHRR